MQDRTLTVYVLQFSGKVIKVFRTEADANKVAAACARLWLEDHDVEVTDIRVSKLIGHEVVITAHEVPGGTLALT